MAVSLKTDLRFPESGQHGHGSRIIHEKAEKILEIFTSGDEGSNFEDIIEGQPYFGTIMRYGSDKFDDNLEIFKAAKQGKEQEKYQ